MDHQRSSCSDDLLQTAAVSARSHHLASPFPAGSELRWETDKTMGGVSGVELKLVQCATRTGWCATKEKRQERERKDGLSKRRSLGNSPGLTGGRRQRSNDTVDHFLFHCDSQSLQTFCLNAKRTAQDSYSHKKPQNNNKPAAQLLQPPSVSQIALLSCPSVSHFPTS